MTDREKLDSIFRLLKGVKDASLTPEVAALGRQIIEIIDPKIAALAALSATEQVIQPATDTSPETVDIPELRRRLNHLRCVIQTQRCRMRDAAIHQATGGIGI